MEISHFKLEALSLVLTLRMTICAMHDSQYWLYRIADFHPWAIIHRTVYMFVPTNINASIYFFIDGFRFFHQSLTVVCSTNKCCWSFAGIEQTPAPAKWAKTPAPAFRHTALPGGMDFTQKNFVHKGLSTNFVHA